MRVTIYMDRIERSGSIFDDDIDRRALRVEARAKQLCPVKSGRLRSSIRKTPGSGPLSRYVTADAVYASWIHGGSRRDSRSGRTIYAKAGPRPFLVDALEAAQ